MATATSSALGAESQSSTYILVPGFELVIQYTQMRPCPSLSYRDEELDAEITVFLQGQGEVLRGISKP